MILHRAVSHPAKVNANTTCSEGPLLAPPLLPETELGAPYLVLPKYSNDLFPGLAPALSEGEGPGPREALSLSLLQMLNRSPGSPRRGRLHLTYLCILHTQHSHGT